MLMKFFIGLLVTVYCGFMYAMISGVSFTTRYYRMFPPVESKLTMEEAFTLLDKIAPEEGSTSLQTNSAGDLVSEINKTITWTGVVRDIEPAYLRGKFLVTITSNLRGKRAWEEHTIFARFYGEEEKLLLFHKGSLISFTGRLESITYGAIWVDDCSLLN